MFLGRYDPACALSPGEARAQDVNPVDVVQGIDRPVAPPASQMTQAAAYAASQQLPMPPLAPLEQQGSGFHVGQACTRSGNTSAVGRA